MKKLYMLLLGLLICTAASAAPDLYLRGDVSGWNAQPAYKFTQDGDIYTLELAKLSGAFKIADASWGSDNYGGGDGNLTVDVDKDYTLANYSGSGNLIPSGTFTDITITFNRSSKNMRITGKSAAATITYAVNGNFGQGWQAKDMTKNEDGLWTYKVTPGTASCPFGIKKNSDGSQIGYFKGGSPLTPTNTETTLSESGSDAMLNGFANTEVTLIFNPETAVIKVESEGGSVWEAPAKAYFSGDLTGEWAFNTEMTAKGNGVFTLEDIEVSATTGYVTFTTGLMNNWTVADGLRYGSGSEDVAVETGQSYPAVAGSDKAFTLAQGTWKAELTFTQEATTVVFTQTQTVVPTAPEALYFHGSIDGDWAFNTAMTKADNTFSHDFEVSNETGYVTFSTALMDNWTVAAGGVRYVPENGADVAIESGVAYKMATGTMGSWTMGSGKYTAVVDFAEAIPTVTFTRTGDIVIPEYPELYLRATDNGWGANESNLMSCDKGIYTITLATLNGSFKIAAKTWEDATTASSENLKMAVGETYPAEHHPFGGNNMSMAETLSDATVVYDANEGTIKVTGTVTECVHTYMMHGQFTTAPADEPEAEVMALEDETPWNDIELSEINGRYTAKLVPAAAEGKFVIFTKRNGVDHLTLKAAEGTTLTSEGNITLSPVESADVNYSLDPTHSYELSLDPETYAITSKDAGTTGIEGIGVDNSSAAHYFNLQGVSVENPSNGLYIVVRNGKATKEYIR